MAENDFFNIKGLGDWPEGSEAPPPPDTEPKPQRPYQHPRSNKKSPKKPILTILIAVVVVALAAGAFVFGSRYKKQPAKASTSSVQPSTTSLNPSQPAATPNTSSSASAGMEQYVAKGSDLNLSFAYPTGWSANPASGITTDQTITLTSPQTTITAAGGSSVTGEVVLTVRPGTAPLNELTANNPTAPQASSQIAYASPTSNQYQYPYITYIHFTTGASTPGAFEEVMITGTTKFAQGAAVNPAPLTGLDPIISASFVSCSTSSCTGSAAKPLSITNTTWTNETVFQQTLAIFQSFKLN